MANSLDLLAIWTVLDTEATSGQGGLHAVPTGLSVAAGEILAGVDEERNRHLLIPLLPGEAFADDTNGNAIRLQRIKVGDKTYLSAVCVVRELDDIFTQFARELSGDLPRSQSPARYVIQSFAQWKKLFAELAFRGELTEPQQIGLLAELQFLEQIMVSDPKRNIGVWTGPDRSQHDFRGETRAVEVKATLAREGRRIRISSVEQLNSPVGMKLALSHTRFERHAAGDSLPLAVERIRQLNISSTVFERMLLAAGYRHKHATVYATQRFRTIDHRLYEVQDPSFPKITPSSFVGGIIPPGTESLTYTIDVSNEPPTPLSPIEIADVLKELVAHNGA